MIRKYNPTLKLPGKREVTTLKAGNEVLPAQNFTLSPEQAAELNNTARLGRYGLRAYNEIVGYPHGAFNQQALGTPVALSRGTSLDSVTPNRTKGRTFVTYQQEFVNAAATSHIRLVLENPDPGFFSNDEATTTTMHAFYEDPTTTLSRIECTDDDVVLGKYAGALILDGMKLSVGQTGDFPHQKPFAEATIVTDVISNFRLQ